MHVAIGPLLGLVRDVSHMEIVVKHDVHTEEISLIGVVTFKLLYLV